MEGHKSKDTWIRQIGIDVEVAWILVGMEGAAEQGRLEEERIWSKHTVFKTDKTGPDFDACICHAWSFYEKKLELSLLVLFYTSFIFIFYLVIS